MTKKVNSDVQRCLLSATQSYGDADSTTVCENLFYVAENSCFLLGNSTNNFLKIIVTLEISKIYLKTKGQHMKIKHIAI